jgi:hypothetical protein
VLEDDDFAVTPLFHNASPDGNILQHGLANPDLAFVSKKNHLIQRYLAAHLSREFFKFDHRAGLSSMLSAARLKYRVHPYTLQLLPSRVVSFCSAVNTLDHDKKSGREGREGQRHHRPWLHGCINSLLQNRFLILS